MRTYRVTLFRAGEEATGQPLHYMGEVESHQRGDYVLYRAMLAHPDRVAHHCALVSRNSVNSGWPMLALGTVQ